MVINWALCAAAILVALPIGVFAAEIVASIVAGRDEPPKVASRPPVAILIPAHNEEAGITATLHSVCAQIRKGDRVLVVADNCIDKTFDIAVAAGAEVVSRNNLERRGKGYALDFGLRHLAANPCSIVIIVDADCELAPKAIDILASCCAASNRPVQAQYLMRARKPISIRMEVAEFAWLVKNMVRPEGLRALGLPCQLMGSGMAFSWASISGMDLATGNLVEDMKMGLDLAMLGTPPIFAPDALVLSEFPEHLEGIKDQRTRWEHGHLATILREAPSVLIQGIKQLNPLLVAMALDLCVPPLAFLALLTCAMFLIGVLFYSMTGNLAPLLIIGTGGAVLCAAVFAAWARYGRTVISLPRLISAVAYLLWKLPMYLRFAFSRQTEWIRSKRNNDR